MASKRNQPRAGHAFSSPACFLHELESDEREDSGVRIKRIYDAADASDGYRALVDRLWPRGISRRRAKLDDWLRDLAPSSELRQWFHRDPTRWSQFSRRYRAELRVHREQLQALRERSRRERVTLLYGARDAVRNHAAILRDAIRKA